MHGKRPGKQIKHDKTDPCPEDTKGSLRTGVGWSSLMLMSVKFLDRNSQEICRIVGNLHGSLERKERAEQSRASRRSVTIPVTSQPRALSCFFLRTSQQKLTVL